MGREIRRVPVGWEHPKREVPNYQTQRMEETYQPLYDRDFETAMKEWLAELNVWLTSEFEKVRTEYPEGRYDSEQPYRAFCEFLGGAPDHEYYRPKWTDEERTAYQMYETVSEGTPVSPVFETKEALVDYLVKNGDFWDQKRGEGGWNRANAERFVLHEWAPSMIAMTSAAGTEIKTPRDGA